MNKLFLEHAQAQTSISANLNRKLISSDLHFDLLSLEHPARLRAESYIADGFFRRYGARVQHFLPHFLMLEEAGETCGVVGVQAAQHNVLFLEQYLNNPVEQEISAGFARPIDRSKIVEIGNLVAGRSGSSYLMFAVLTALLYRSGFHWMIFTATEQVERIIQRMGFTPISLSQADPARLKDGGAQWGTYYETCPKVQAGHLPTAYEMLVKSDQVYALVQPYLTKIQAMSHVLEQKTLLLEQETLLLEQETP